MRALDDRAGSTAALPTKLLPAEAVWNLGTLREGLEDATSYQQAILPHPGSEARLSPNRDDQETVGDIFDTNAEYFDDGEDNFNDDFKDLEVIPLSSIKAGRLSDVIDLVSLSRATTRS